MSGLAETALVALASLSAFAAGVAGFRVLQSWRFDARRRAQRQRAFDQVMSIEGKGALERSIVRLALQLSQGRVVRQPGVSAARGTKSKAKRSGLFGKDLGQLVKRAGMDGRISEQGIRATRLRLACFGAIAGAVLGAALSFELGCVLALVGVLAGFCAPTWALRRLERERSLELERSLPEMLEVVALGLRSGLSFDRCLQLYSTHFPSSFARACASAQRSWSLGLLTRDEALRELARSYRSDQLERTAERITRSLRFGSALAPDLEAAASEARARRRAQVEERVSKAPVKMMVPTGALILPAMLILVLGPILLELMG